MPSQRCAEVSLSTHAVARVFVLFEAKEQEQSVMQREQLRLNALPLEFVFREEP
jgi:hypothetical protein